MWPFEKRAPWSIHYAINNNNRSSEKSFCFKIYRQSVCFLLLLLFCFFLSSTELHEVNNYDTNLSTEANASTPRYGPVPYFVVIGTNQHGIASSEKSFFFFAKTKGDCPSHLFSFLMGNWCYKYYWYEKLTDDHITRMLQSKLRKDQGKRTKFIANALL